MNITKAHVGKTGKLHPKGGNPNEGLSATIVAVTPDWVDAKFEGATHNNNFRLREWDFTPDTPPLPTTAGVYAILNSDGITYGYFYLVRDRSSDWQFSVVNGAFIHVTAKEVQERLAQGSTLRYLG